MKKCKICEEKYENVEENFHKNNTYKCGYLPTCKNCRSKINKEYMAKNRSRIKRKKAIYYKNNIKKIKEYYAREDIKARHRSLHKKWLIDNRGYCKEYYRKYNKENKRWRNEYNRKYHIKNSDRIRKKARDYYKNNKEMVLAYNRKRRKLDVFFSIRENISRRINRELKEVGLKKTMTTIPLLGCSISFLKKYLESKFVKGMNWNNYGIRGWHIDHIKPCVAFDLSKEEQQKKCFHYANLQPLWWYDNVKKSSNYNGVPIRRNK